MDSKRLLTSIVLSLGLSVPFNSSLITVPNARAIEYMQIKQDSDLEKIIEKESKIKEYLPLIEEAIDKYKKIYPVDPLLVIALMKAETYNFNNYDISWAGAAGLAQIIPETAEEYGIKAYNPEYLHQAREDRRKSFNYRNRFLKEINNKSKKSVKRMIKHKNNYHSYKKKSDAAFKRYKEELKDLIKGKSKEELRQIDERFIPEIAIDFSVKYLAELLKSRKGDIREAVSAYNAGLGAVRRYKGIPPYNETVKYQNKIINYYRDYKIFMERK